METKLKQKLMSVESLENLSKGILIMRPVRVEGRGRYRHYVRISIYDDIAEELKAMGCKVEYDNFSPRGGKLGEYIDVKLTSEIINEFREELENRERQKAMQEVEFQKELEKAREVVAKLPGEKMPVKSKEMRGCAYRLHRETGISNRAILAALREREAAMK